MHLQFRKSCLLITLPSDISREEGLIFAKTEIEWLRRNLQRTAPSPNVWRHDTEFLFRGKPVKICVHGNTLSFANEKIQIPPEIADLRPLVEGRLQDIAEREMRMKVLLMANRLHIPIKQVIIKKAASYWGRSATSKIITMDWRLIQAPAFVLDYVIYHELAHQIEMNHSSAFWRIVADWCPNYKDAEAWLTRHPSIRLY